jgi:serine/threonine-protein kinase
MNAPKQMERIGRYQVLERVGKGGMGVLYRGFDPVLDREVAIKLMLTDFTEDTEQMRPRFYREARAAAKLNHRNIVTIFEFAEESNVPYIVMEFLRGTPLGARMGASGQPPLSLDDKLNIIAQLCDGLGYAHDQGVVHRDVKPDNVFILEDGSVKLLDFGIAKLTSSNLTRQGDVLGSASYMSPEQVGGSDSVDGRADLFSTGVMLYELLSGHKPFQGDAPTAVILKILKDDPTPLDSYVSGLPPQLLAAVTKALAKTPDQRFQSASEFSRELQAIRKSLPAAVSTAELDETRFASTQVMKALHEEFQNLKDSSKSGTGTAVAVGEAAASAREAAAPPSGKKWLVPAVVAAAVVIGAVFVALSGRSTPPSSATPTQTAAAPPPAAPAEAPPPTAPSPAPAASTPAVVPAAAPRPAAAPPPVPVALAGGYPFAVLDGGREISPASAAHDLKIPAGKTLVLSAPQYFLRQTVRIDGTATAGFEWNAPGLGKLDVRSAQETCDVMIGDRKLGNPPLVVPEIAAGQYRVDISCAGEVVKSHFATVRAGQTYVAAIR